MRRTSMRGAVVLVLMVWMAVLPGGSLAAPNVQRTEVSGVATDCWESLVGREIYHENKNNAVYLPKAMNWKWVTLLDDGRYFTGYSTMRQVFPIKDNGSKVMMHVSGEWVLYPGLDPELATGWYEGHEVASIDTSIPLNAPGFFVVTATLNGRGTLQGQNLHVTMPFRSWETEPNLCGEEPAVLNFDVTMEFTNAR